MSLATPLPSTLPKGSWGRETALGTRGRAGLPMGGGCVAPRLALFSLLSRSLRITLAWSWPPCPP
eukprot:13363959-Alexandrium_andersonii.AAC.1